MNIMVISKMCAGARDVVLPIVLHNIMNITDREKRIDILSKDGGDTRLKPLVNIFDSEKKIKCPSGIFRDVRFVNFTLGHKIYYNYLKQYFK
jgi:hypothetical protein